MVWKCAVDVSSIGTKYFVTYVFSEFSQYLVKYEREQKKTNVNQLCSIVTVYGEL